MVVFIDELDRCKPDYAIRLLERIKHYFGDERITFVLSLNMDELRCQIGTSSLSINCKYNILTRVVGGRALIRSEPYGKDDAYEYI